MICLYLYQYLSLWDASYIVGNRMLSTFQCKFNHVNPFSHSWDISRQSFYSYWWPDISVICCYFCTCYIYTQITLIWGFSVQLSLWKSVHWLWRYKLNEVWDSIFQILFLFLLVMLYCKPLASHQIFHNSSHFSFI